ncbi:MAG: helix-turn-helix transcriptional regulator [Planctomyces sp.]|nr:helix-turn-helix transcriptional regulator [Planctomyces sp.]
MGLSAKQQQIREREQQIIRVARAQVLSEGYHGFGLEAIAVEIGVSRGTLYNHFSCKEDLILAVLMESLELRLGWVQRAASFRGTSRQRMTAILVAIELFARIRTDHYRIEEIVRSGTVWEKANSEKRIAASHMNGQATGIVAGVVRDAIVQGDLEFPADVKPEEFVFGVWSLIEGGFSIHSNSGRLWQPMTKQSGRILRLSAWRLLDGFGWKPLSTGEEFSDQTESILKELFSAEFRLLKQDW